MIWNELPPAEILRNIRQPGFVLQDGRVLHLKPLLDGVKGNLDFDLLVVLVHHIIAEDSSLERRNPLLPIYRYLLAFRQRTILEPHIRVHPRR